MEQSIPKTWFGNDKGAPRGLYVPKNVLLLRDRSSIIFLSGPDFPLWRHGHVRLCCVRVFTLTLVATYTFSLSTCLAFNTDFEGQSPTRVNTPHCSLLCHTHTLRTLSWPVLYHHTSIPERIPACAGRATLNEWQSRPVLNARCRCITKIKQTYRSSAIFISADSETEMPLQSNNPRCA